ncbi:FYVE, RhoGEF and PH domain-containing protein 6 [Phytophthora ramorum]|uniref:FYVE, RhoGEF and PH domain-containing protein 6 n=1 Tax=Phytophthora ramorum TaxID=164328 RepID=UPI00309891EF|nr:FYVE, RhoGEF and PH domain-containing protein 6 [Phytophthora ramorum]
MSSPQPQAAAPRTAAQRRRHVDARPSTHKKLALRPGIVLFDPKALEGGADWQPSLTVELLPDNQDEEEDDEEGEEEDNQEGNDVDPDSPAAKQVRLRARVIDEICETEKSYVSDIRTLLDHYIVALEDNAHPIMEDAQIAVFFNNLRHLVMLNSKLLTDLLDIVERRAAAEALKRKTRRKRKSVKSPVAVAVQCEAEGVGAVFCRYAPLFKLYGGYAKDYEEVAALLQNFGRDTRLGFTKFLETCQKRSGSPKPFESLLIMPIQRIPRYKLLLERLCELTSPEHPDAAFLTEAVNRVRAAASLINETVRRQENLETVLQAQQKFAGQLSLFTADRRLLKSGRLTKMSTKRQEDVMLHLFNDILLYSGVLITGGYRVRRIVHLHSKAVGVKTELPAAISALFEQQSRRRVRKDCGFVVTSREKTFILFTETPEAQREWVDAIASAAQEAQKKKQTGLKDALDGDCNDLELCEGPADAAALWVPDEIAGVCTICKASFRAYYRRRHHCRRCGAVVCDTCSSGRAPLFVGESSRAERVCSPCFKILDLVRQIATHWLSRVVEFRGVLRRRRFNKWTEHYYELRAGVLKQFTLETSPNSATPVAQNGNGAGLPSSGSGSSVVVGEPPGAGAGNTLRCCTDELTLAGAIVIHRSDSRAHKNRFCFQISTSEYDETDSKSHPASSLSNTSTPTPKMLIMDADLSIFFSSVDQIYTLNQQLLDHLSRHLEETSAAASLPSTAEDSQADAVEFPGVRVHRAGAIFHAYAPLMQLYTSYASRHSAALNALDSPQFAGFLRELPPEADVTRLRRYLNMPVERIPRYKMLFQELLGSTPSEHVDFVPLQAAIRSVDRVASKIEEISERRENARAVATVSAKVGIDLTSRHFVRDGMLRKVCRSKVQTYYFVLLEDAMVYGRHGGLHKKFRMIDLWECKVADDTESMPGVITTVGNSNNAFCFYSPLKSFILLAESEGDKVAWTTSIRDYIGRNLRGQTHPRRGSARSELLVDNDDDSSSGYELEGGFVIKNGWLNVCGGAVATASGPNGSSISSPSPKSSSSVGKKPRRLWITLTLQTITLGSTFKTAQPEETIPIELCEVAPLEYEKSFRMQFLHDTKTRVQTTYVFEALSLAERDEWVRALTHCISGGNELDLRRRSLKTATLAPIFMFDKVSNVCTICTHSFAVYRPRHHCRLCGSLVCGNCSKRRWTLSYSSSKKASRVCDSCAESTMSITRSFAVEV